MAPTEFVTAFTTVLAQAYTAGPDTYLAEPDLKDPELGAFDAVVPLIKNSWQFQQPRWGVIALQPPDGMATCQYTTNRLDPEKDLTTLEARWHLWGGPKSGYARWYATATTNPPIALVKAITQSVSDPAPLPRWKDSMLPRLREAAQLTPVTPPPPPVPTPLDVQNAAAHRPPALGTRSVPRWSTTSLPVSAAAPRTAARR
jgi:hypothetical protein